MLIGPKSEALIISYEGWDVPWRWPGEDSGITIPIGYDLGYEPFSKDWNGLLDDATFEKLSTACGVTGQHARVLAPSFRGVMIPRQPCIQVFESVTIPRYENQTKTLYPTSSFLPPETLGALVSLIFNRGTSLVGPRRIEMSNIKTIIQNPTYTLNDKLQAIADQIKAMTRLWPNSGSGHDLYARRMDEAALIESCIQNGNSS